MTDYMSDKILSRSFPFPVYFSDSDSDSEVESSSVFVGGRHELNSGVESTRNYATEPITETDVVPCLMRDYYSRSSPTLQIPPGPLVENLCANYGYSIYFADIEDEVFDDDFFKNHASRNGYVFTDVFLSRINELRDIVLDYIDKTLHIGKFCRFLCPVDSSNLSQKLILLDSYCISFSSSVYSARDRYVVFLRSEVVAALIDIISCSKVVREGNECAMSCSVMDQLFLHITTIFERLFMLKVMYYWRNFCEINKITLLSFPHIDYSDPFVCASCCGGMYAISLPIACCPIAFDYRSGVCVSFMGANSIDRMIDDCKSDCISKLEPVIIRELKRLFKRDNSLEVLEEFKVSKLDEIIAKSFFKFMCAYWSSKFFLFFNELMIWPQVLSKSDGLSKLVEVTFASVFNEVKQCLCSMIESFICCAENIIFDGYKVCPRRRSPISKCGLKLNKEFYVTLINIVRKYSIPFKLIVSKEFVRIIKKGTIIDPGWYSNCEMLLSVAVNVAKEIVDGEYLALKSAILNARIVCDMDVERELNWLERVVLNRHVMVHANMKLKEVSRLLWADVVGNFDSYLSGNYVAVCTDDFVADQSFLDAAESSTDLRKRKRKRNNKFSSVENIHGSEYNQTSSVVPAKFGKVYVYSEFNDEIDSMILGHVERLRDTVKSIRADLESQSSNNPTGVAISEAMRAQSMSASAHALSEFMRSMANSVFDVLVHDAGTVRRINNGEIEDFLVDMNRNVSQRHNEILFTELP